MVRASTCNLENNHIGARTILWYMHLHIYFVFLWKELMIHNHMYIYILLKSTFMLPTVIYTFFRKAFPCYIFNTYTYLERHFCYLSNIYTYMFLKGISMPPIQHFFFERHLLCYLTNIHTHFWKAFPMLPIQHTYTLLRGIFHATYPTYTLYWKVFYIFFMLPIQHMYFIERYIFLCYLSKIHTHYWKAFFFHTT